MAKEWVDLRQPFYEGMPFSKVLGPPSIKHISHKITDKVQVNVTEYQFTTHIGTHVDAARHFVPDGPTIDQYPFERFVGDGVVWDMRGIKAEAITAEQLKKARPEIKKGDIVLIYTGWAEKYGTDSYHVHPYLREDAARWIVEKKVNIIGFDTLTLDLPVPLRKEGFDFPVHRILLGNDVLVIEHLGPNLARVAGKRLIIGAFPLKIVGADGAPSPIFALLE
jgi:arylformamidase